MEVVKVFDNIFKFVQFLLFLGLVFMYAIDIRQSLALGRDAIPRKGSRLVNSFLQRRRNACAALVLFLGLVCVVAVTCGLNQLKHPWGLWAGTIVLMLACWSRLKNIDYNGWQLMKHMQQNKDHCGICDEDYTKFK